MTLAQVRDSEDSGIILATCGNEGAWLLHGENHIFGLLEGDGSYPVPVVRLRFDDDAALANYLGPDGPAPAALWAIHSNVIARLRAAGELTDRAAPAAPAED